METSFKYVLCRPRGGLNDQLCAVMDCFDYSRTYGRKLIVDSRHEGLFDNFWNYFLPTEGDETYTTMDSSLLDTMSIFPPCLFGRVSSFVGSLRQGDYFISDSDTGIPLTFDFNSDYAESILVHEQGRVGGHPPKSLSFWSTVELRESLRERILKDLGQLPHIYKAVHIRHTDYQTPNYEFILAELGTLWSEDYVLLCSDNELVFLTAQRVFNRSKLLRLSKISSYNSLPLHTRHHGELQWEINAQSFTDLFALALAAETAFIPVTVVVNGKSISIHSGFSMLASQLAANRHVLSKLLKV